MRQHYAIVILGLDNRMRDDHGRLPGYWRKKGIDGEVVRLNWNGTEPYASQHKKLLARIDQAVSEGKTVSLIGVSAGAGVAVNAYVQRKKTIHKMVFVCGRLGGIELIVARYYEKYPIFGSSMSELRNNLDKLTADDKSKMLCMYGLYDGLTPEFVAKIDGAATKRILSIGHLLNLAVGLTVYSGTIAGFIKSD